MNNIDKDKEAKEEICFQEAVCIGKQKRGITKKFLLI